MKRTPLRRKAPLQAKAGLKRKSPVRKVNQKRRASEFARCYHSKERVAWVQRQPCVVCTLSPCDNAHIRTGGTGRKAGYRQIVPLCSPFYDEDGCHRYLHAIGRASFERTYGIDLVAAAAETERRWQLRGGKVGA